MALLPPLIKKLMGLLRGGGGGGGGGRKPPDYQGQLEREKAAAMGGGKVQEWGEPAPLTPIVPKPGSN